MQREEARKLELEEVRRAAMEGRFPDPDAWRQPVPAAAAPEGELRPGQTAGETRSDPGDLVLRGIDLGWDLLPSAVRYVVPGTGRHVWVHAMSTGDLELMTAWTFRPEALMPDPEQPERHRVEQARQLMELRLAQVVLCCRTGPSRKDARCFDRGDIAALRDRLPAAVITEITRISDELAGTEELLGAAARRFFALVRSCLQISGSPSTDSTSFPDGFAGTRARLLSLATRWLAMGRADRSVLAELEALEAGGD